MDSSRAAVRRAQELQAGEQAQKDRLLGEAGDVGFGRLEILLHMDLAATWARRARRGQGACVVEGAREVLIGWPACF